MTTDNRKVELGVTVTDDTKPGFQSIAQGADNMAAKVTQSADKASKSVGGIGDGGDGAAQKLDKSTRSIINSVQRATAALEAGGNSSSKYFESIAGQRNVNADALRPYLDQLKQAERAQQVATGGLDKMGLSAKATSAALRQVPAQFTDIITSLQGGQAPLTVLLQQGGQLKDVFGGVGAAASALGNYVLGLVNPFTLAAAAAAALAVAYNLGSKEADAYNKALILTGNAAGTTAGQLQVYAEQISRVVGTQGKAAETLAAFAASGKVGSENLKQFSQTAIEFERATGTAVSETVKKFAELRNAPLQASLKLNETTNYLTESLYKQIKALEDQGRATEAAKVAQEGYEAALRSRSGDITQNLGTIETAWKNITDAIKKATDSALNFGRKSTPVDRLKVLDQQILENEMGLGGLSYGNSRDTEKRKRIDELRLERAEIIRNMEADQARAEVQRKQAEQTQAVAAFDKTREQFLDNITRRNRELTKAVQEGVAAGVEQKELLDVIVGIREKYEKKSTGAAGPGQNEVAAIRAQVKAQQEYLSQLKAQTADPSTLGDQVKLTDGQQKVLKIQEELKTSITGVSRAEKERALAAAQTLVGVEKMVLAQERQNAGLKAAVGAYDKLVERTGGQADSIRQQAIDTEAANLSLGKSKTAIEAMALAQLKANLAEADASDSFAPKYVAALNEKVKAQERYVAALEQTEVKQLSQSNAEYARVVSEETNTLNEQVRLVGATRVEREKLIGQRKVELDLAKRISEIDKAAIPEAEKVQLRAEAAATSVVAANNAATRAVQEDWQRTSDIIESSLTDALLRGFESGKGFLRNLIDTTKNLFATLVLRPQIQAVLGITGVGASGAALANGSSTGGVPGLSSIGSFFGGNSFGTTLGGAAVDIGNTLVGFGFDKVGAAISGLADGAAAFSNLQFGLTGLLGGLGGSLLGGQGSLGGSLGSTLGLAIGGPIGAALGGLGGAIIGSLFGKGTPYNQGGNYQARADGTGSRISDSSLYDLLPGLGKAGYQDFTKRDSSAFDSATKTLAEGLQSTLSGLLQTFGKEGQDVLVAFRNNGKKSLGQVNIDGTLTNFKTGENDPTKAFTAFTDAAATALLDALDKADIPAWAQKVLDGVGDAPGLEALQQVAATIEQVQSLTKALQALPFPNLKTVSEEAAIELAKLTGGLDGLNSAITSYYAEFYTEAERSAETTKQLTASLAGLGVALPASRDAFRALVNAQDLSTEAGRKMYAELLKLAPAFASVTQASVSALADIQAAVIATRNAAQDAALQASYDYAATLADQKKADKAFRDSIRAVSDSLFAEANRIRSLLPGGAAQSFAAAQSQFAITSASARSGNAEAAKLLPGLAQQLLDLAASNARSAQELALIRAQTAASLDQTGNALNKGAGINYTAPAALTQPATLNTRSTTDDVVAALKEVRDELAATRAASDRTAASTLKTANLLTQVTRDGDAMVTTT